MSNAQPATPEAAPQGAAEAASTPEPAQEPDWKAESRKWEERAKANKDAAEKLAAFEESQKTEAQKLADRAEAAEKERDALRTEKNKRDFLESKGIPAEYHELVTGADESAWAPTLEKLQKLIKPTGPVVRDQERTPKGAALSEEQEAVQNIFST